MKNKINILIFFLICMIMASCAKTETEATEEEPINGAFISQDGFYPGDDITRSSVIFENNALVFTWNSNDKIGIFPTSKLVDENRTDNATQASQMPFNITKIVGNGQLAEITAKDLDFKFEDNYLYTGYAQYQSQDVNYNAIPFDFSGQAQRGYVDMVSYYTKGKTNTDYKNSEKEACRHISEADHLISAEMDPDDQSVRFRMRHIGAIARFFLLAPMKKLKIKELKLISNNNIFYENGTIDLTSHSYQESFVPSPTPLTAVLQGEEEDHNNYGVSLPPYSSNQLTPGEPTNCLTLHYGEKNEDGTWSGVWTLYDENDASKKRYGSYFISYLMMYPIRTKAEDNVYIYVTAEDESGHELYFRTGKLQDKQMYSGYVYVWTNTTEADTPIELTATLQPWQEIVGSEINTDLEN